MSIETPPAPPAPAAEPAAEQPHTLTGEFRTHENFHSRHLPTDRTIIVYLPPGYDPAAAARYPVLYLHDGQNVFDKATSVGEEWCADETAQALIAAGAIHPLIMVGIYNTGERRIDEYTPTRDEAKGAGGQADLYGKLIVEELKPFIDREYHTLPGAEHTALAGSSLGGLVTLYLGLKYPTVFSRLAALSPSVWWDDRAIARQVEALGGKTPQRIWLDAGTAEGEEVLTDARRLRDALVAKGWAPDGDLRYIEAEGAGHDEKSWCARFEQVLRFLYGK
jgi:predicted alpha/beta superfamily hydrolase